MRKLLSTLFLCTILCVSAQKTEEIDRLFEPFNRADHPAVAAVVINKGEVIYKKAFGSSHLDHQLKATTDTKFQLAGLSKHFTAFAVLLLEEEGKISLKDNVRTYLDWLPEYDHVITIDHLLTMTSGLPEFWTLKNIAGWHRDDVFTQDHARELIKNSALCYEPGKDYAYSNTEQLLLAEIVEKVSGKSFDAYLQEALFDPLEMSNTLVAQDFEQFIPNVAASYDATQDGFKPSAMNYGIYGPTNAYSTVEDLAKWEMNLSNPKVGSTELVAKLYTNSTLENGETMDPTFGRLTYAQQLIHKERGIPKVYQTGSLGGYASSIFKFMDYDFTVIVLSSGIPYNGYLGMQTAYLFLEENFIEPASIDFASLKTKKLKTKQLERFAGVYWNERAGYSRTIKVTNDTLEYVRTGGRSSKLVPLSSNEFQMIAGGDEKIMMTFKEEDGNQRMELVIGESAPLIGSRIPTFNYSENQLEQFAGRYYSKALNTVYEFEVSDGNLIATNLKAGSVAFEAVKENVFESGTWFLGCIAFEKEGNKVSGFNVSLEEVKNLWFERL